jgi:hypothetical protein
MSYEADIYGALIADEGIAILVGEKVFWDCADGDTSPPFIVLQTVSNTGETAFDGSRDNQFPLVQFAAWASTKAETIQLRNAIKSAIEGVELAGTSQTSLGYSNDLSTYDQQTKLFGHVIDYRVSTNTN